MQEKTNTDLLDINYLSSTEKIIFFVDEDVELIKQFGADVAKQFLDFEIVGLTSYADLMEEVKQRRPTVIISCMDFEQETKTIFELADYLRSQETTRTIPLIVTATRKRLEEEENRLAKYQLIEVPKAIRTGRLLGAVSGAVDEASKIHSETIFLQAGQVLFREGERSHSIYMLKSGKLAVIKEGPPKTLLAEINDQQLVGEMAFLNQEERSATIQAVNDSVVIELKLGDPHRFVKEQPFWLGMILKTLIQRIREMDEKLALHK